jgi:DNA-binding transcriptional MerR regulator
LLYYESIGLLKPSARTPGNYRSSSEADSRRLERICIYRDAGIKLADIRSILTGPDNDAAAVLQRRLIEISGEIERSRDHQQAILKLLKHKNSFRRTKVITKEKWISIMKASGLSGVDMQRWHQEFERSAPQEHQEFMFRRGLVSTSYGIIKFLEFLHIPADEIRSIRDSCRK